MELFEILLHFDEHLANLIQLLGPLAYVALFAVIFAETGLVIAPFLPGDSLLFAIGALSGSGFLNIWIVYVTLLSAAIMGDSTNYWIGRFIGPRVFAKENSRIFKKAYLEKTREFYAKYGKKTIILARFVPIVRTFAPFVAGVGKMPYKTFVTFSILGSFIWITSLTFAGYFFGGMQFIKDHFEVAVIGVIFVSLLPMIIEYIKAKRDAQAVTKSQMKHATYEDIKKTFKKEHLND
ncbi:MAG TPA: DedA family protein [Patescibacteria group bacterium]|nr:DedA family protein [Patescibacteria group bacterium]